MSHTVPIIRQKSGTVRVNAAEVELLLLNGWQLTDEPDCSGARMLPPSCIHRVPKNEKAGRNGCCEPARNIRVDDGIDSGMRGKAQRF